MVFLKKLWNKESGVVMTTKIYDHDIKLTKDAVINDKILRGVYDREVELYEIAFEEGAENKSLEIATNLLKSGMTVEFVHENTKLPIDEIKKLKNSFSNEVME